MTYKKYEFTAYTEADLLAGGGNGSSIGRGDTFTLSGNPTVTMSTWDNDGNLSGDNYRNEHANDGSGQYARVDGARVGSQMYAEQYHVLKDAQGNKYYMIEVEVEGYNAPGAGDDFFTFYGRVPPAGVELTVVGSCNVKGCWVDYKCLGAGESAPPNTPPTFTNLPSDGIICVDENQGFVIDINASDDDGDALTYEIVGGRDASFFEIDADTGELTFKTPPDYENPQSGGNSNTYDVTVKVSDGNGGTETKTLWVKVKDVEEETPGNCIVIEAETMDLCYYKVESRSDASGGAGIKLTSSKGYAKTTFAGADGTYDLKLTYMDESDGQGFIDVFVNGKFVFCVALNKDNNGNGADGSSSWSTVTIEDLQLESGDVVTFKGRGNCYEFARIDKIELCQDGDTCPEGYAKLDFEGLSTGEVVSGQLPGVTISAQRDTNNTAENDAMIFDSANPTGGDSDLATASQGNILIISEDNDSSDPDDAVGGEIVFDFDYPSDLYDIKLIDIEETGGEIRLYDEGGNLIKTVAIPAAGNNSIQTVLLEAADVARMEIDLAGSGAVDDLCWRPGEAPPPGSLSGRYFCDDNRDGVDNGEPGIEGVIVELLDANGNGTGVTTSTAADGSYSFTGLAPGTYGVKFTDAVSGKDLIEANVGNDDTIDSDAVDLGNGMSQITNITVVSGQDTPDNDAGVEDRPGSLSGTYFCDDDKDGIDDGAAAGDADIAGKTVTLFKADGVTPATDIDGNPVAAVLTDANGDYRFDNLAAGDYVVVFEGDVKEFIAPNVGGDDTVDSDVINSTTGATAPVTVVAGQETKDVDAGVQDPGTASLGGRFFCDEDDSDTDTTGDGAVAGATVQLLLGGSVIATQLTAADGSYLFENLDAGDYQVRFVNPGDKVFVATDVGADDTIDSDAVDNNDGTATTAPVTVNIGDNVRDVDAGIVDPGTAALGDKVFIDANKNGVQDDGEVGLDGVGVTLYNAGGVAIATTTTMNGGMYLFDGLDAGTYSVGFDEPDGFDFTAANAGGDDAKDSDADTSTGRTGDYTLSIGETNLTVDAGVVVNEAPIAADDAAMYCADEAQSTLDLLANDSDPEGDPISVTSISDADETVGVGGTITLASGATVTLNADGSVSYDGIAAHADLLIGEQTVDSFSYTLSDGFKTDTADVDIKVCGALNTLETIKASLPAGGIFTVLLDEVGNEFFDVTISGTGDARFDGITFKDAYCVAAYDPIDVNVDVPFDMYLADEASVPAGLIANPDDLDIVNWILNQDFKSMDNGDGTGENFTDAEIQGAIWGFTDDIVFVNEAFGVGTQANAQEIYDLALASGDGFVAGEGDIVGLILDPTPAAEAAGNIQPFIIGVEWDSLAQDCVCV